MLLLMPSLHFLMQFLLTALASAIASFKISPMIFSPQCIFWNKFIRKLNFVKLYLDTVKGVDGVLCNSYININN